MSDLNSAHISELTGGTALVRDLLPSLALGTGGKSAVTAFSICDVGVSSSVKRAASQPQSTPIINNPTSPNMKDERFNLGSPTNRV